jgi:hypothetical protein
MTLGVVEEAGSEVTLDHAVVHVADLVNDLEVVLKTDVHEAGLKASHMTTQEVVPSHQLRVVQDHDQHRQEIKQRHCDISITNCMCSRQNTVKL